MKPVILTLILVAFSCSHSDKQEKQVAKTLELRLEEKVLGSWKSAEEHIRITADQWINLKNREAYSLTMRTIPVAFAGDTIQHLFLDVMQQQDTLHYQAIKLNDTLLRLMQLRSLVISDFRRE